MMFLAKPETIKFENTNDVIDYVAVGIPPRKKDFEKVIASLGKLEKKEGYPYIPPSVLSIDKEDLQCVLQRVYEDNRRNYAIGGIIAGATLLTIGVIIAYNSSKKKDDRRR